MNDVEAIKIKLSKAKNIWDVIDCCYRWREALLKRVKKALPEGL